MNKKNLKILLKELIKENYNLNLLEKVKTLLNNEVKYSLDNNLSSKEYFSNIQNVFSSIGFVENATGGNRSVFTNESSFFVVKVQRYVGEKEESANAAEISISEQQHDINSLDIMPYIYDYDKFSFSNPKWIIVEKVIPLSQIKNLKILSEIFPTFWNLVSTTNKQTITADQFKKLVSGTFKLLFEDRDRSINKYFSRREHEDSFQFQNRIFSNPRKGSIVQCFSMVFYNIADYENNNLNVEENEEIFEAIYSGQNQNFIEEDFRRIIKSTIYIGTNDFVVNNLGVRQNNNLSPNDIVILDFDFYV